MCEGGKGEYQTSPLESPVASITARADASTADQGKRAKRASPLVPEVKTRSPGLAWISAA